MKTLIIVSHPELDESGSQQYLLSSIPKEAPVTVHPLEKTYPDGQIDVQKEQELLREHDRILFQFPFYWYSTPPLLKKWQDEVLTDLFAFGGAFSLPQLTGKEFSLVMVIGAKEEEYQAGGAEGFSLSALTTPFQALARKTGMQYKRPLFIHQFAYLSEKEKMQLLVRYQQHVTMEKAPSLAAREEWIQKRLEETDRTTLGESGELAVDHALELMESNRMILDELQLMLDELNG